MSSCHMQDMQVGDRMTHRMQSLPGGCGTVREAAGGGTVHAQQPLFVPVLPGQAVAQGGVGAQGCGGGVGLQLLHLLQGPELAWFAQIGC